MTDNEVWEQVSSEPLVEDDATVLTRLLRVVLDNQQNTGSIMCYETPSRQKLDKFYTVSILGHTVVGHVYRHPGTLAVVELSRPSPPEEPGVAATPSAIDEFEALLAQAKAGL